MKKIKQFEIYDIDLEPHQGSEQGGRRPCLVVQTNVGNHAARTFIVIPFTSPKIRRLHKHQVFVPSSKSNGLKKDSKLKTDQIRVIDRKRLKRKMGELEIDYQPAVFEAIDVMIDRFGDFR